MPRDPDEDRGYEQSRQRRIDSLDGLRAEIERPDPYDALTARQRLNALYAPRADVAQINRVADSVNDAMDAAAYTALLYPSVPLELQANAQTNVTSNQRTITRAEALALYAPVDEEQIHNAVRDGMFTTGGILGRGMLDETRPQINAASITGRDLQYPSRGHGWANSVPRPEPEPDWDNQVRWEPSPPRNPTPLPTHSSSLMYFRDDSGRLLGQLNFSTREVSFTGEIEESARMLFDHVKYLMSSVIKRAYADGYKDATDCGFNLNYDSKL